WRKGMKGKKILLSKAMDSLGLLETLNNIDRSNLYVINYHRLYRNPLETQFNTKVFTHTEEIFYEQIKWFKKNYDIFGEEDLIQHLEGNRPLKRRTVVLTFDDGYLDNYEIAYPILKAFNIPAIFFIPYNQVDRTSVAWWDLLAYFVKNATVKAVCIAQKWFDLTQLTDRDMATCYLCWHYQLQSLNETGHFLQQWHTKLGVQTPLEEIEDLSQKEFMNWDQVKELSRNNITIGSHTMSHNVLANLILEEQERELVNSKALLEKKLDQEIRTVAYPVGKEQHFTEQTKELAEKAGYRAAFSFIKGYSKDQIQDKYSIPRMDLCSLSTSHFKAQTLLAKVF
ncbi:MAG: polysaccharide deacetylase family protein, partial [Bacteriovoracaceae bacterium]|nr:polysaccharide deacetylase family protein [Bacteriovoracaceae bacterium]